MSYAEAYQRARQDADGFWAEQARAVAWYQAPTRILDTLQDGTDAEELFDGVGEGEARYT